MDSTNDGSSLVGDVAVLGLLRTSIPDLYRYAIRLAGGDRWLAEDLVQEASIAGVRRMRDEPSAVLTTGWLMVVVRRRYLDHVRTTTREQRRASLAGPVVWGHEDVEWAAVGSGQALQILGGLPADQRAALVLRYVDDLPVAEVATLMDRTIAATESLLARGRRELARRVKGAIDG